MQTILAAEAPPGAIKSLVPLGCRTASGIRTQQVEIKYRKPTALSGASQSSGAFDPSPRDCGDTMLKMIRLDSFEKSFGSKDR